MQEYNNENQTYKEQVHAPTYEAGYMSVPYDLQQYEQQQYQRAQTDGPEPQATSYSQPPHQQSAPPHLIYAAHAPYSRNEASTDGKIAAALC